MHQDIKKTFKIISLSVFFLFIIIFALFRSKDLIFGVKIKNVNLISEAPARTTVQSGGKVAESIMKVKGNAKNGTFVALNGREISVDETGNFDETIALLSGYNIVEIKAKDKFDYIDEKNYKIIYLPR